MSSPADPGTDRASGGSSRPVLALANALFLVFLFVLWGRVSGAAFWTIAISLSSVLTLVEVRFSTEPDGRTRLRTFLQHILFAPLVLLLYVLWNRVTGIAFWMIAVVSMAALTMLAGLLAYWIHGAWTRRGNRDR